MLHYNMLQNIAASVEYRPLRIFIGRIMFVLSTVYISGSHY